MRRFLSWTLGLLVLGTAALLTAQDFNVRLRAPLPLGERQPLEIPAGASLQAVIEDLQGLQLIRDARTSLYLRAYARITGLNTQIKAGEYEIQPGMSAIDALELFVSGKTLLHPLRVIEGTAFSDLLAAVRAHPMLQQTLPPGASAGAVMQAIGRSGQHPEGRFFPDTYHFPRRTTDIAFLRRAAAAMDAVLVQQWQQRAADLPYTSAEQALVMASIIEKETGVAAERAEIAGVFVNRLRQGMRLQTDPTVIYGIGPGFDGNLRRKDLQTDTPYNTYTRSGLPPTPICLPGRAALHAALHPAATKALFFVARGDGSHAFSETLAQHVAAVRKYQLRPSHKNRRHEKKN